MRVPFLEAVIHEDAEVLFQAVHALKSSSAIIGRGGPGNSDSVLRGSLASPKPPDGGEPEAHGDEENETESRRGIQSQRGLGGSQGRQDAGGVDRKSVV